MSYVDLSKKLSDAQIDSLISELPIDLQDTFSVLDNYPIEVLVQVFAVYFEKRVRSKERHYKLASDIQDALTDKKPQATIAPETTSQSCPCGDIFPRIKCAYCGKVFVKESWNVKEICPFCSKAQEA
jgi:hypothetical protein